MSQLNELTLSCFCFLALQTECSQCCGRLYSFDYEHNHLAAISDSKVIQISLNLISFKKEERNKQILKSLPVLGDNVKFNVHILQEVYCINQVRWRVGVREIAAGVNPATPVYRDNPDQNWINDDDDILQQVPG